MADVFDKASDLEEFQRGMAIKRRVPEGPKWSGVCLNCECEVVFPLRFCDNECRADWEKRVKMTQRNGRPVPDDEQA